MILLDEDVQWDGDGKVIAHWTQLDFSPGQESIPQKVEEQALSIKKEYLAWVYDLGKYKVEGQTLISFLKIFDNFSFWRKSSNGCNFVFNEFCSVNSKH